MQKFDVQIALEEIRDARTAWSKGITGFNASVEHMMVRLLHEAARCFMSAEEVARYSGLTPKRVRALMRQAGLNPRDGRALLSKKAAEALNSNAQIMGINPNDMDLMSPLAYLPMGEKMKRDLRDRAISQVTDLDDVSGNEFDESGEALLEALTDALDGYISTDVDRDTWESIARDLLAAGWHK